MSQRTQMDYDIIKNLNSLLKPENESDSDDELPSSGQSRIGPGHLGPSRKKNVDVKPFKENENNSKDIWDDREVDEMRYEEYNDHRKVPEYDIKYSQSVSPEDIYLQMGCKTPLSSSCENMIVTVNMMGESRDRIDLNIQPAQIDVRSPMYRLCLPLPHEVDENTGSAKWDEEKSTLVITLRIVRELDFINF
ncbi:dynein axonemal assembly factor 6 [Ischnura elegans]|uniref:dynein axonemal assembly factor 6 n=1 Tax=Ischnura elegans TaxID=197161 RepID=UPI001ED89E62|nr:dynein axonemal assembly factor 6 [Ischnura elegans]